MLSHSEARQYSTAKRKFPIPGATINTATYNPIEATRLRLVQVQNAIFMAEQEQARNRRGKRGAEIDRKKRALSEELDLLTQTFAILTAIPKEEKKTNPIVHEHLVKRPLLDRLPPKYFKPVAMAWFALSVLLTPQAVVLAQNGQPTPESSGSIPLTQRYTLLFRRTDKGVTVSAKSDPKFWNEPNLTVGQVVSAVSNKFGIADQKSCAAKIVFDNNYNIETESTAQRRLNRKEVFPSERQIVIESAQTVIDFINACSLKAQKVIQTVLPSVTPLPPSKIPPTTSPTKAQPSPTPIQPTSTSTPQAETPSSTDSEKNIKYILGGAFVLGLLGLGSLVALVIHNSKSEKKKEGPRPATLRSLPNTIDENDPRVIQLSGQGQPFKAYVGEGKPDIAATFEPRVMVIDADDPNLLQRVLNTLASAIKREDPDIVRAQAAALMHHEKGHARNTSEGVAIIGIVRNQETKEIIGAAVRDPNFRATAEEQEKMFLGPDDPSAHDARNADLVKKEKQKKKNN